MRWLFFSRSCFSDPHLMFALFSLLVYTKLRLRYYAEEMLHNKWLPPQLLHNYHDAEW